VDPQRRAAVWLRWPSAQSAKVELQTSTWSARGPMTEERLVLAELLEKAGESDFLRAVAEAVLQLLMETDVEGLIGAGRYERSGERTTWRNGYRERTLDTRLGALQLRIPKLRQGSYTPVRSCPVSWVVYRARLRLRLEPCVAASVSPPMSARSSLCSPSRRIGRLQIFRRAGIWRRPTSFRWSVTTERPESAVWTCCAGALFPTGPRI